MNSPAIRRRTVISGTAWATPAVISAHRLPASAASTPHPAASAEYGLFVTTGMTTQINPENRNPKTKNYVGYDQTDDPSTGNYPTTPSKYFAAVKSGSSPQTDTH